MCRDEISLKHALKSRGMNVTGPKGANSICQTKMRRNVLNSSLIQTHSQSSDINSNCPTVSASQAKVSRSHKRQSQLGVDSHMVTLGSFSIFSISKRPRASKPIPM